MNFIQPKDLQKLSKHQQSDKISSIIEKLSEMTETKGKFEFICEIMRKQVEDSQLKHLFDNQKAKEGCSNTLMEIFAFSQNQQPCTYASDYHEFVKKQTAEMNNINETENYLILTQLDNDFHEESIEFTETLSRDSTPLIVPSYPKLVYREEDVMISTDSNCNYYLTQSLSKRVMGIEFFQIINVMQELRIFAETYRDLLKIDIVDIDFHSNKVVFKKRPDSLNILVQRNYSDVFDVIIEMSLDQVKLKIDGKQEQTIQQNRGEVSVIIWGNASYFAGMTCEEIQMQLLKFQFNIMVQRQNPSYNVQDSLTLYIHNRFVPSHVYNSFENQRLIKDAKSRRILARLDELNQMWGQDAFYCPFQEGSSNVHSLNEDQLLAEDMKALSCFEMEDSTIRVLRKIKQNVPFSSYEFSKIVQNISQRFDQNVQLKKIFHLSKQFQVWRVVAELEQMHPEVLMQMAQSKFYQLLQINLLEFEHMGLVAKRVVSDFVRRQLVLFSCNNYSVTIATYFLQKFGAEGCTEALAQICSNPQVLANLTQNKNMYELYKWILEQQLVTSHSNKQFAALPEWTAAHFDQLWNSNLIQKHFILNVVRQCPTCDLGQLIDIVYSRQPVVIDNLIGNEVIIEILQSHKVYKAQDEFLINIIIEIKTVLAKSYSYVLLRQLIKNKFIDAQIQDVLTNDSIENIYELAEVICFEKGPQYVKLMLDSFNNNLILEKFQSKLQNIRTIIGNSYQTKVLKIIK